MLVGLIATVLATPIQQQFVPDQYIVVFKDHVPSTSSNTFVTIVFKHFKWLDDVMKPLLPKSSLFSVQEDSRNEELFSYTGYWDAFGLLHKYHLPDFKGYSVRIPSFIVKLLERHADIAFIEKDQIMSINAKQLNVPAWGLIRISERDHPASTIKTYTYPDSAGSNY
jgi:hypothetical protein